MMTEKGKGISVLAMNTLAFTVCFASWLIYGVLITFLVDNNVFTFDKAQIGWPIWALSLPGAIGRLPAGILTDKYGGRVVYPVVMLLAAGALMAVSSANS